MLGRDLLALPVHAGGLAVIDLHAVHAHIALARLAARCPRRCPGARRLARDHARQGDKTAAISRPGLQHRKLEHIDLIAAQDHFLAGRVLRSDHLREEPTHLGQHRQHLQLVHQTGWRHGMQQRFNPAGHIVERLHTQS